MTPRRSPRFAHTGPVTPGADKEDEKPVLTAKRPRRSPRSQEAAPVIPVVDEEDERPASPFNAKQPRRIGRGFPLTPITPSGDETGVSEVSISRKRRSVTADDDFVVSSDNDSVGSPSTKRQRTGPASAGEIEEGLSVDSRVLKDMMTMLELPHANEVKGLDWTEALYTACSRTSTTAEEIRSFMRRTSWHTHCTSMDALWDEYVDDIRPIVEDLYDTTTLAKPSGPLGAVLHIQWHYPTFATKKTNRRFGHVLVCMQEEH
ncbi:hypothetical protein CFAM422_008564 [Trichoderma lentiforme]|uniref:Uncharacterized protein n=1 Tax=Trichoderma lentiforme TaxID=1567552 RepID=A0A9P4XCA4_9HYPO|nr:hypothetical protein CFAM422_008564 [Trichoderma lentiforme]